MSITSQNTDLTDNGEGIAGLVQVAASGDHASWEALVREFEGLVAAIARAHRLSDADAADVAQATWMRLFEHLDRLNDPARVGAWLATTARRECLRVLRQGQRLVFFGEDGPEPKALESWLGENLLLLERDRALWRSFARMRASDQALLALLMADPRPAYGEIAAELKMPIGSIGPNRARALDRLRGLLETEGELSLLTA